MLAHSARYGCPAQPYEEHIQHVVLGVVHRARAMLRHYSTSPALNRPSKRELLAILSDGASFHDFGKLDDGFQETLQRNQYSSRHVRHEDAGVAFLALYGAMEAAGLVSSHHQGLVCYGIEPEQSRSIRSRTPGQPRRLSVAPFRIDDAFTQEATSAHLKQYRARHEALLGKRRPEVEDGQSLCTGFARRLLLSALVDSDHTDTARHYRQHPELVAPAGRWAERLDALKKYVEGLPKPADAANESAQLRQQLRDELFSTCLGANTFERLRSCDAVVGSGKTTAVMAHLLKVAADRSLRHIFVVLPYTNIIRQSVNIYRQALCLPGEDPEAVVAEHHHQASFKDLALRGLTTLWRAPIIVTTAVQFFETLAANKTGKLRKLHELPGSAVFLDEAHAALPAPLWPICWNWLREWIDEWNGHLVLASGSLAEFWRLDEFRVIAEGRRPRDSPQGPVANVSELAAPLRARMRVAEHMRIRVDTCKEPISADDLCNWVESSPGPRLVIVNTVQSAATLAMHMASRAVQGVMHLSTALAPIDRNELVQQIETRLKRESNWTLVATSLVEAGMNFSFATGFRQRCSASSLIQTGGRVNRGADKPEIGHVWDFDFADTDMFPDNPGVRSSKLALGVLFDAGLITPNATPDLAQVCVEALRMEFKTRQQGLAFEAVSNEMQFNYPLVAENCRVIQSDTRLVLVNRNVADRVRLKNRFGARVSHRELIMHSVQLYHTRIISLGLEPVIRGSEEDDDLYVLPEGWRYDPLTYGYMAGWFDLQAARIPVGFFV